MVTSGVVVLIVVVVVAEVVVGGESVVLVLVVVAVVVVVPIVVLAAVVVDLRVVVVPVVILAVAVVDLHLSGSCRGWGLTMSKTPNAFGSHSSNAVVLDGTVAVPVVEMPFVEPAVVLIVGFVIMGASSSVASPSKAVWPRNPAVLEEETLFWL